MITTHNLLDRIQSTNPFFIMLHGQGFLLNTLSHVVFSAYPLIPWVGVTAVGYGLGRIYQWPADQRRTFLLRLGLCLTIAFPLLRWTNVYGDPNG